MITWDPDSKISGLICMLLDLVRNHMPIVVLKGHTRQNQEPVVIETGAKGTYFETVFPERNCCTQLFTWKVTEVVGEGSLKGKFKPWLFFYYRHTPCQPGHEAGANVRLSVLESYRNGWTPPLMLKRWGKGVSKCIEPADKHFWSIILVA